MKRCQKATGNSFDKEWGGGFENMQVEADVVCNHIKSFFYGLEPNVDHGVHYDKDADTIWDIYQVIRHQLWLDNEDPEKPKYTVDAYPAHLTGKEPLAKISSVIIEEQKKEK